MRIDLDELAKFPADDYREPEVVKSLFIAICERFEALTVAVENLRVCGACEGSGVIGDITCGPCDGNGTR